MQHLTVLVAAIAAVFAVPSTCLPQPEVSISELRQRSVNETLLNRLTERDNAIFTIGYSDCSEAQIQGATADVWDSMYTVAGQVDFGCVQMDDSSTYVNELGSSFFNMEVCGQSVNFYDKNGNYDFYINGGDGTLLGTCYPAWWSAHFCLEWFGSCAPQTAFLCYYSYQGTKICG